MDQERYISMVGEGQGTVSMNTLDGRTSCEESTLSLVIQTERMYK